MPRQRSSSTPPRRPPSTPPPQAAPAAPPLAGRLQEWVAQPAAQATAVVLLLGFFVVNGIVAARTNTPTIDEFVYLPIGYYHLRTGDLRFDSTNPPLMKLAMAVPLLTMNLTLDTDPKWRADAYGWGAWVFATHFMDQNRDRYLSAFFAARMVILWLGVATGVLLLARGRDLLTGAGALGALFLYCTLPPVIGHSAVATLDMGVTALLFAAFIAVDRFARSGKWPWAATTGVLLGLAFATKGVTAIFLPLIPVLAAVPWRAWDRQGRLRFAGGLALIGVTAWIALLAVYGFSGFPLPAPVLAGLKFQTAASQAGEYPAYLNGRWSQTGWWYYYLVALLYKVPLPFLVLLGVGAVALVMRRRRDPATLWMLLPPLLLVYVLSFHFAKDYGVRYLLPAVPFLVLVAGYGVDVLLRWGNRGVALAGGLLAWQLVACAVTAPHHIAYFNELAGGPDEARHILLDSNLDWGQDLGRLKTYLDSRGLKSICLGYFGHVDPHVYGIDFTLPPSHPAPGLCAVSANFLAGYPYAITYAGPRILGVKPDSWTWFERRRPVARVGRSIYVFDVTEADARRP